MGFIILDNCRITPLYELFAENRVAWLKVIPMALLEMLAGLWRVNGEF